MAFPNTFANASTATGAQLDANFNALSANNGSSLLGYQQTGTGTIGTTVGAKLSTMPNVVDWMTSAQYADGQTGSPALNVSSAFTLAAQNAPAQNDFLGNGPTTIIVAKIARIFVPSGKWTLGSLVDTANRNIVWVLDAGTVITDPNNLNGRIERSGQRVSGNTNGIYDYGAGFSVLSNANLETGAQVSGFASPAGVATYTGRDSVALYAENTARAPTINITTANYTATTIIPSVPLTADQIKQIRVGMAIDTLHATKYTGFITSWALDGSSITVSNWYLSPGPGTPATPANGIGAYVNPITGAWAINTQTTLNASSTATSGFGYEIDVLNNKSDPGSWGPSPLMAGVQVVSTAGTFKISAGVQTLGPMYYAYYARGQDIGFKYDSGTGTGLDYNATTGTCIHYQGGGDVLLGYNAAGQNIYQINAGANPFISIGNKSVANTPFFDLHSSGNAGVFDTRILASGGSAVAGTGNLSIQTGNLIFNANLVLGTSTLLASITAPTIASGFGTNPSIVHSNGTAAFQINVGTGGTASSGVINLPAATNGWMVMVSYNGSSANMNTYAVMTSTTQVTLTNQTSSTGIAVAWPTSTILNCIAMAL